MTLFIDKSKMEKGTKKTTFLHYLNPNKAIEIATCTPKNYDIVVFLGHHKSYGDVFQCSDNDTNDFGIYFGEKGNEFD